MLAVNTTWLYEDTCSGRFNFAGLEPTRSSSARILSAGEFQRDCASHDDPQSCRWYHTMGMMPGEIFVFRNAFALHGTAAVGIGLRVAIAMDCWTWPNSMTE